MKAADTCDGINLCRKLYEALNPLGYFPALTGGLLYKDGQRKDIDIVLYRHRQQIDDFEISDIAQALMSCGMSDFSHYGFVTKCKWEGFSVDLFNPEADDLDEHEYGELVAMIEQERVENAMPDIPGLPFL